MTTKKLISFILIVFCIFLLFSCTKENPLFEKQTEEGTFIYSIKVLNAEDLIYKTESGLENIEVSISINDSVYTDTTNAEGFVTFFNVPQTYIPVSVKNKAYTGAEILVNLNLDSAFQNKGIVYVSTKIALLPLKSEKPAKISGKILADLNLTNSELETYSNPINISANIPANSLKNFVEQQGFGKIEEIFYSNSSFFTKSNSSGEYSFEIPAIPNGLDIIISGDDFRSNQTGADGKITEKVFENKPDTIKIYPNITKIHDIIYK